MNYEPGVLDEQPSLFALVDNSLASLSPFLDASVVQSLVKALDR